MRVCEGNVSNSKGMNGHKLWVNHVIAPFRMVYILIGIVGLRDHSHVICRVYFIDLGEIRAQMWLTFRFHES